MKQLFCTHGTTAQPAGYFCTNIQADPALTSVARSAHPTQCSVGVDDHGWHRYQYIHAFTGEIFYSKAHTRIINWPGRILEYQGNFYLALYSGSSMAEEPDTFLGAVMAPGMIQSLQDQMQRVGESTSKGAKMILSKLRQELSKWMGTTYTADPYDISSL